MNVFDRDVQLHRDERAHPGGIEHAGHADDAFARELGQTIKRLGHGIEWIRYRNNDAVGAVFHDSWRDALHDFEVVAHEIVAAHTRLSRLAGCDHHDVGPRCCAPVAAADDSRVGSEDRAGFVHVERNAGRLLIGNVDDDDVGQLLFRNGARDGRADVAGAADNRLFVSCRFQAPILRAMSRSGSRVSHSFC
jgi:hypothetical protein